MLGSKVIIRTYSAGCWYGTLTEKAKNEVIISEARRLWSWTAATGISLSGVALEGIKSIGSRIEAPVDSVWLEAIEIIPCTETAISSIEKAPHATPR